MKRLWIRAHALTFLADAVCRTGDYAEGQRIRNERSDLHRDKDPNDMVIIEITDEVATVVQRENFLLLAGKVLADGEEPPYVGRDPKLAEGEL